MYPRQLSLVPAGFYPTHPVTFINKSAHQSICQFTQTPLASRGLDTFTRKLNYFIYIFLVFILTIPACFGNGTVVVIERDSQGKVVRTVSVRAEGSLFLQLPTAQEFTPREEAVFIRGARSPSIVKH